MPPTANAATSAARPGLRARPGPYSRKSASAGKPTIKDAVGLGLAVALVLVLVEPAVQYVIGAPVWAPADMRPASAQTRPASAQSSYELHLVPYGIERGFCDRNLVASDSAASSRSSLIVGEAVGARMDMIDHRCVSGALEYAPDQRRILWRNPDTGVSYTAAAMRTYQNDRGVYCREYDTSAVQAGQIRQVHGVACRKPDGTWTSVR